MPPLLLHPPCFLWDFLLWGVAPETRNVISQREGGKRQKILVPGKVVVSPTCCMCQSRKVIVVPQSVFYLGINVLWFLFLLYQRAHKLTFLNPQAFWWNTTLLSSSSAAGAVQLEKDRCSVVLSVTNIYYQGDFFPPVSIINPSFLLLDAQLCMHLVEILFNLPFLSVERICDIVLQAQTHEFLAVSTRKFKIGRFTVTALCFSSHTSPNIAFHHYTTHFYPKLEDHKSYSIHF